VKAVLNAFEKKLFRFCQKEIKEFPQNDTNDKNISEGFKTDVGSFILT